MDKQTEIDLLYLAERIKVLQDAVIRTEGAILELGHDLSEWSKFLTVETLKQSVQIHKQQKSDRYFRNSLKERHKENYEKFESLFLKVKQLFGGYKAKDKGKTPSYLYSNIIDTNKETPISDNSEAKDVVSRQETSAKHPETSQHSQLE